MKRQIFCIMMLVSAGLPACKPNPEQSQDVQPAEQPDLVLRKLEQAIRENPDSVKLYDIIADTLSKRKDYAAAAAWYSQLIKRGADSNYYYWFIKGDLYRRAQVYDSAIASYQTYLAKFPDDEQVLLNLANTYAEAGNRNAIDLANMIAARFPNREMRSEAAFIKGVYYNQVKQYGDARKWLDSTIMLNYTFSEAYMEKGYSQYDEGMYKAAFETFRTLANINNGYADAWYWMAKSKEALNNYQEAIKYYENAYALDRNITEALTAIDRLKQKASTFSQKP